MADGTVIVLSGPSGCGKNTVYEMLRAEMPELEQTVSATTRRPRPGEREGVDYYFLSPEAFEEYVENDAFIEHVRYGENRYGTLKSEIPRLWGEGKKAVLIIEVRGAKRIKEIFPRALTVFLAPPSMDALIGRINKRGDMSETERRRRLEIAESELACSADYDCCVVNDDLAACVEEVREIILTYERSQLQ